MGWRCGFSARVRLRFRLRLQLRRTVLPLAKPDDLRLRCKSAAEREEGVFGSSRSVEGVFCGSGARVLLHSVEYFGEGCQRVFDIVLCIAFPKRKP